MTLIQSITIPNTTLRDGVVYYNINIITSTESYSIEHRYNDFASLHYSLGRELSKTPPPLPPSSKSWYSISKTLTKEQVQERRLGLQTFLKGIIVHKDSSFTNSRSIERFLAPTEEISKLSSSKVTSESWLTSYSALLLLSRETTSLFAKRDALRAQHSAESHSLNLQGKKSLVELITSLEALTRSLVELEKGGMMQGELERRRNLLESVQVEVEKMGQLSSATTATSLKSGSLDQVGVARGQQEASTSSALFKTTKSTGRILGSAAIAQETSVTRPLDNGGLLQLQQNYMESQDSKLDDLAVLLRRQRMLGEMIANELGEQGELIDGLEQKSDKVTKGMKVATKTMKRLG